MAGQKFNWKGISENDDGTYTTTGKIEKKRLLKSLHSSGYKVRSRRNPDGTWTVSPVGTMRPKKARSIRAYRSSVSVTRRSGGYVPVQGRYVPIGSGRKMYRGNNPRPRMIHIGGIPSPRGAGLGSSIQEWRKNRAIRLQKEQDAQIRAKKEREIMEEKMKKDREIAERQATVTELNRQREKARLQQESTAYEKSQTAHAESQRLKQIRHEEFQSRLAHERTERQKRLVSESKEKQRVYEESAQKSHLEYAFKPAIDQAALQKAREQQVSSD